MGGDAPSDEVAALKVVVGSSLAALLALLLLPMGGSAAAGDVGDEPLVVRTSVDPVVRFGDRLVLHVTVLVDGDRVDADRLRVTEPVAPLTRLSPTRISRSSRGTVDTVTFDLTAACLDQRCVSPSGARALRLPPVAAEAPGRDGSILTTTRPWPRLTVRGRVPAADVTRSPLPFRTDVDPPPVSYRVRPATLASVLGIGALAVVLTALVLAGLHVLRTARRRRIVQRTELERALAFARNSETRPPEDRRRALGLLARVLGAREERLAPTTSTLAWSAPEPSPDSISHLVDDVVREVAP